MDFRKSKFLYPSIFLILAVYYTLPFLMKISYWGVRDWDLFTSIAEIPAGSIIHFGQFPFWNPYMGGGNILFHHPEVGVLTPFFLLYMIFGAVVGLKLQVLICYFLGFWGSHKLFNSLGMSKIAGLVASVAYFGSVHFALHFAEGHIPFTHYAFLPWFVFFVLQAGQSKKNILWASLTLALMILGNGAAIPLLYTMLFTSLLIILRSIQNRNIIELKNLILATVGGIGLSAIKFLPMAVYLFQNKWPGNPEESIPINALGSIFFGLKHSLFTQNFEGQYWAWHEYGAYISPVLVLLAIFILIKKFKPYLIWFILATFFLVLGMGNFGTLSPWNILSHFPGFESARCTGRSFQFVILPVAILAGHALDRLSLFFKESHFKFGKVILPLLGGIIIITNMVFAWPIMDSAFHKKPINVVRTPVFQHVIDDEAYAYQNYLANKGSLITPWLSAYHPSRAIVDPDENVLMEYIKSGEAEIIHRNYNNNEITYELNGIKAGKIMICMGYDPGWYAVDGRQLIEDQRVIAFDYDKGKQIIELKYRTPYFYPGLIISLLTIAFMGFIIKRKK